MDIWMAWCKKVNKCSHCGEPITAGQPIVRGKLWKGKKWPLNFKWHPQCWMDQAIKSLETRPYVSMSVGRPRLKLSEEDRRERLKLLRRRASARHRQKKAARENNIEEVIRLEMMIQGMADDILRYGGTVPSGWRVD